MRESKNLSNSLYPKIFDCCLIFGMEPGVKINVLVSITDVNWSDLSHF